MEDNRKIKIRKALKAMRDASKGIPQQEAPNWDRGRKFVEKIRKDRKIEKELKLDYDLVKKFKKQKQKISSTKQKLKELKVSRNVVPYGLRKNYIEEQSNVEMITSYNSIKKNSIYSKTGNYTICTNAQRLRL